MSRMSISTPCPPPTTLSGLPIPAGGRRVSIASSEGGKDDTVNIEYTREIQLGLQHAKPRRRSTFQRKEQKAAPITIFEDVLEDQELVVEPRREMGGSTLLAKPAQKPSNRGLLARRDLIADRPPPPQTSGPGRRVSSIAQETAVYENNPETCGAAGTMEAGRQVERKMKDGLKKEPRRRTIFVPSEDTTLLTIHPGAHTTDRLNDTFQLPNLHSARPGPQGEIKPSEDPIARQPAKRPRLSMALPPKRVPLQSVGTQEVFNIFAGDIAGLNSGKENVPPGGHTANNDDLFKMPDNKVTAPNISSMRSSLFQQTAASKARQSIVPREAVPMPRKSAEMGRSHVAARRESLRPQMAPQQPVFLKHLRHSILPLTTEQEQYSPPAAPKSDLPHERNAERRQKPIDRKVARLPQYPVLSEDLAQPELYEDSWLSHQEIALTEVINQLFRDAEPGKEDWQQPRTTLRERLVKRYHRKDVTTLHRRLHASLLYGALSRPKDAQRAPDPAYDIGLRKRFLSLWLDSYDQKTLRAAAEVVFGHQLLPRASNGGNGHEGTLDPHRSRRTLIGFLETFLVEVEDVEEPEVDRGDDPNPRWRKMVLRSLMLIWLLDQVKDANLVRACLFRPGSPRKSSAALLHSLAAMLIPSIGDVTKVLRHLDYEVTYVQDPLDEVQYRVDNIAVDLRDGILLTRLVELLLFSSKKSQHANQIHDATVTIQMPDFTILESALYDANGSECARILSQHLKMPCIGRVQKVYNVDIAISALRDHGRLGDIASEISADDIVNGHRERTLGLLWSLVSSHGLEQLLDYRQLIADIRRSSGNTVELPDNHDTLSQLQQESLLKKWASGYCTGRGVRIGNLTTAFADGKAYVAILDAFAANVDSHRSSNFTSADCRDRITTQLRAFGCSTAFIDQITSTTGTIPSRKTTVSNLAFLASRLLPLARSQNAALMIQRAFRCRHSRTTVSRRIALMRLAHACATVVKTQQTVTAAATVIQKAWRRCVDARIGRLNNDVEKIQAVAKGWIVRRNAQSENTKQSLRVMGGW